MSEGRAKSEVRKIQITGGSTYIVSLPKKWVLEHGLSAKDQIRIEWRPSGTLRVIPEASMISRRREVDVDLSKIPDEMVFDHLIAAYLSGNQLIRIHSKSGFSRHHRKTFRSFIGSTRGIEISSEDEKTIEMISLINPAEMPLYSTLNRMYLLISSQVRDVVEVMSSGDKTLLDDSEEREGEVDALRLLLERQVGQILESASIESNLGISRWEAAELSKVVRTLERMGDHSFALCAITRDRTVPAGINTGKLPLSAIPVWQSSIKQLISNFRNRRISEIHQAKAQLISARNSLENYEDELRSSDIDIKDALFLDRISESLRRMCAYSINLAEVLLNIQAHRDSVEVVI